MTDLNLAQRFSIIGLNAQSSLYMTNVKKVSVRCMAAAVILDAYLDNAFEKTGNRLTLHSDVLNQADIMPYQEMILKVFFNKQAEANGDLKWWLKKASSLSKKKLKSFELTITDSLKEMGMLEEIPSLLGSDLYYVSAGVAVKDYRSNIEEYSRISESVRAEILEEGSVTDDVICMIWLLRESGCMHDFFSQNELAKVNTRMNDLFHNTLLAQELFPIHIRHGVEIGIKQYLQMKSRFAKTTVGTSINFFFPMLERSKAVFIETEAWFSNSSQRLNDVVQRLESYGHEVNVLEKGTIPTIKIDNLVYEAVPHVVHKQIPIQGVRLVPRLPV
ncbi:hypothetical protein [Paenibacillus faecalis]|uniref:hypothetical protein n=1 Tax=Paenibacillus faecalis TaxID=2079532 RepID=UPI000D101A9B|nr:hypothetical protein [Paenibacillus faecalis]